MTTSTTIYRRVATLARFDGWGLVIFGIASFIFGIIYRDRIGFMLGLGLATLGAIELHGRHLWLAGNSRASGWLAGSQIGTLLLLVSYAARSYWYPPIWRVSQLSSEARQLLESMPNYDATLIDEMFPTLLRITYLLLILAVVGYQGSMAFYYLRAKRKLRETPPPL